MLPIIEIFGKQIGMYGVMTVVGFAVCFLVGSRLIKRFDINIYDFALTMITAVISLLIFSCLVYGLTHIRLLINYFTHIGEIGVDKMWEILKYCFGGIVFYGGFIGGGIGILAYTKFNKTMRIHRDHLLDIYAVLTPLFHVFGRIGCFLGGCCYGVESEFGFTVHNNTINPAINDVNRFPIQLVESACNLLIFLFLLWLFKKSILENRLIYMYMLIYPVVRFITEFFRGDEIRGFFFGLSTSQWISIFLFVFALIMLPVKTKRMKRRSETK